MKAWYWYHDGQVIKKFLTEDQARKDLNDPNALIDIPWQGEGEFMKCHIPLSVSKSFIVQVFDSSFNGIYFCFEVILHRAS